MKKISKIKIPKKYNSVSKKIDYIGKKIDSEYDKAQGSSATTTTHVVKMGEYFINAKKIVKKEKGNWSYHLSRRFPYITQRTVQRYMSLGRRVDLKKHPALAYISQSKLEQMILFQQNISIGEILRNHDVDPNPHIDGRESIGLFKKEFNFVLGKVNGGWGTIETHADPLYKKRKKARETAKYQTAMRKLRKDRWETAPPEIVAKRVNGHSKTVRNGLDALMNQRPEIYEEMEMGLLVELQALIERFLEQYERPVDPFDYLLK